MSSQEQSLTLSGEVELPYNQNNISLTYSNLAFQNPGKSEYRYTLGDDNWTNWQQSHQASFAQLSPGTYTFKVQARNADRVEAPNPASFTFTIAPPWYQSTIAYLLYVIFGIGGLAYASVWYSNYRTEQRAIRMRAEQAEELAKLDRMRTNLLTNISHELRTPLTLVLGPIEQLQQKAAKLGKDWKRRLDIARRNSKRLQELVEQVLDLTRLDAKQLELDPVYVELTTFLRRISESFQSMAERNKISIETKIQDSPIPFQADADKLEKIMVNLFSNAIKFTPPKGTIRLEFTADEESVQIKVSDTGRGIPEEHLPHIFDRFHSTSEQISGGGKGLGVGLAITKEFVELHDGSITVESEVQTGTTFTIILPFIEYDTDLTDYDTGKPVTEDLDKKITTKSSIPVTEKEDDSFVIMVVEDNEDMRDYIAELLNKNGAMQVETAENGLEAKKQLSIVKPDLIISDIMMPEMGGFTFVEYVRSTAAFRLTPIVMLSARAEVEDRIQGYEIGVSDYLVKPFDETELKVRVKNLLHRKTEREKHIGENGKETDDGEKSSLVDTLRAYVEANLSESKLTVEQLSEEVNLSRRQLYRNLKAETGCTPAEFIREIRLYKARNMLERGQKQMVSEVAYAVGFSTPSYFSQLFKERFGRSPGDYD